MAKYPMMGMMSSEKPKKIKGLDNGTIKYLKDNPAFGWMPEKGEGPNPPYSVTPNGYVCDTQEGRNAQYQWGEGASGSRWANNEPWNGNRTGEDVG